MQVKNRQMVMNERFLFENKTLDIFNYSWFFLVPRVLVSICTPRCHKHQSMNLLYFTDKLLLNHKKSFSNIYQKLSSPRNNC
jgi:hypothetical protein